MLNWFIEEDAFVNSIEGGGIWFGVKGLVSEDVFRWKEGKLATGSMRGLAHERKETCCDLASDNSVVPLSKSDGDKERRKEGESEKAFLKEKFMHASHVCPKEEESEYHLDSKLRQGTSWTRVQMCSLNYGDMVVR